MAIPETIKLPEASERWNCCTKKIRDEIKAGNIVAYKPGRNILVDIRSGDEWFKSKKIIPVRKKGRPRKGERRL